MKAPALLRSNPGRSVAPAGGKHLLQRMIRLVTLRLACALLAATCGASASRIAAEEEQVEAIVVVTTPPSFDERELSRALLAETNRVRKLHHRRSLRPRDELQAAAVDQSSFMALRLEAQHGSLLAGQADVRERVRRHGLFDAVVAENVVATPMPADAATLTAQDVAAMLVAQWMDSPGHRATLLDARLTHFGGAVRFVRFGKRWTAYGTQVFQIAPPKFGHFRGA